MIGPTSKGFVGSDPWTIGADPSESEADKVTKVSEWLWLLKVPPPSLPFANFWFDMQVFSTTTPQYIYIYILLVIQLAPLFGMKLSSSFFFSNKYSVNFGQEAVELKQLEIKQIKGKSCEY